MLGQRIDAAVEHVVGSLSGFYKSRSPADLCHERRPQFACRHIHVGVRVVGVVGHQSVGLYQSHQLRHRSALRYSAAAMAQITPVRLFLHEASCHISHREVHRVAPLDMFRLYRGKHGVCPA